VITRAATAPFSSNAARVISAGNHPAIIRPTTAAQARRRSFFAFSIQPAGEKITRQPYRASYSIRAPLLISIFYDSPARG